MNQETEMQANCETATDILARYASLLASDDDPRGNRLRCALVELNSAGTELMAQDLENMPPPPTAAELVIGGFLDGLKVPDQKEDPRLMD